MFVRWRCLWSHPTNVVLLEIQNELHSKCTINSLIPFAYLQNWRRSCGLINDQHYLGIAAVAQVKVGADQWIRTPLRNFRNDLSQRLWSNSALCEVPTQLLHQQFHCGRLHRLPQTALVQSA